MKNESQPIQSQESIEQERLLVIKQTNKIGKGIEKLIGKDNDFILINITTDGALETISNIKDPIRIVGLIEWAKVDHTYNKMK